MYRTVFAFKDAVTALSESPPAAHESEKAPGLMGAYRMLHDDDLWHALAPVVEALKTLPRGMNRHIDNPIGAFSGKAGSPS